MSRTPVRPRPRREPAAPRLPLGEAPLRPSFRRERAAIKRGVFPVAGVDEAGRGPLAGPVVAAAVILDPRRVIRGLRDSKQLTPARRAVLALRIRERALGVAVAVADHAEVDLFNILQAAMLAMKRALLGLTT